MLFVFVSFVESRPTLVLQWLAPYFSCCVHQQKKSENEADQKKLENIFFSKIEKLLMLIWQSRCLVPNISTVVYRIRCGDQILKCFRILHTLQRVLSLRKIWINGKNKNERKTQYPSNLRKFLPLFVTEYIQRTMKLREIEM